MFSALGNKRRMFEQFYSIKDFIVENEKQIENREKKLLNLLKEDIAENPDRIKDDLSKLYQEDIQAYPSFTYNAYFMSSYSLLEYFFNKICIDLQNELELKIKVKDLSGNGSLSRSKNYLTKILLLDLTDLDKEWIQITKYQKIRNLIVHENSSIPFEENGPSKMLKLINEFKSLEVNEKEGFFKIKEAKFLFDFISLSESFLENLINKIWDKSFRSLRDHNSNNDDFDFPFDDKDLPF